MSATHPMRGCADETESENVFDIPLKGIAQRLRRAAAIEESHAQLFWVVKYLVAKEGDRIDVADKYLVAEKLHDAELAMKK